MINMKHSVIRGCEALVVIAILIFIVLINKRTEYIDVTASELIDKIGGYETAKSIMGDDLSEFNGKRLLDDFSINASDYNNDYIYYGKESIMDNDTLLIFHVSDNSTADKITSAIKDKNSKLADLFQSYAVDQYDLLNQCILEQKGNYVIYIVSPSAKEIYSNITNAIKK